MKKHAKYPFPFKFHTFLCECILVLSTSALEPSLLLSILSPRRGFCAIQTRWPWILGCRCLICPHRCAPASTAGGIARNYDGGGVRSEVEINSDAHQQPNRETSVREETQEVGQFN